MAGTENDRKCAPITVIVLFSLNIISSFVNTSNIEIKQQNNVNK